MNFPSQITGSTGQINEQYLTVYKSFSLFQALGAIRQIPKAPK